MNKKYQGMIDVLLYYVIATVLIAIVCLIEGNDYGHGPGLQHILIFLFFIGGAGWFIVTLITLVIKPSRYNAIVTSTNGMIILLLLSWFYISTWYSEKQDLPEEIITIEKSSDTIVTRDHSLKTPGD